MPEFKECRQCGKTKPMDGYYKNSKTSDGRFSACMRCAKANSSYAYHRKKRLGIRALTSV